MLAGKGGIAPLARLYWLWPIHAEFLIIGWSVQLAMGVAYWILPRYPTGSERGRVWPVAGAYALLNLGTLLAALGGTVFHQTGAGLFGRALEATAVGLFVAHAWPRVKAFGT